MNKAESQQIAAYLELLGYQLAPAPQNADLIVLNTCVVRQSAEDKVLGTISYLKGLKNGNPQLPILVTGCFVNSKVEQLERRFPHIDLFFKPGAYPELLNWTQKRGIAVSKTDMNLPLTKHATPNAFIPIIQGCDNFCSYCIVPYRRGREKSRPLVDIVH